MSEAEIHPVSWHPHGEAILDYLYGREDQPILNVYTVDGDITFFPAEIYFRDYDEFSVMDEVGLSLCKGRVLDVGAGAGAITLYLQAMGLEVVAIDIAEGAVEAMNALGVKDARQMDIFDMQGERFDTLLCMMNGIGFVDSLEGFKDFLDFARTIINPGGKIIFDSSDLKEAESMEDLRSDPDDYYGRIWFQLEYKGKKGAEYHWLYLDPKTLQELAKEKNWEATIEWAGEEGAFVASITPLS